MDYLGVVVPKRQIRGQMDVKPDVVPLAETHQPVDQSGCGVAFPPAFEKQQFNIIHVGSQAIHVDVVIGRVDE